MRKKIINIILDNNREFISGEEISKQLGISRSAVWKHIKSLKEEGYNIESINKKGYRLIEKPKDLLSSQNIAHELNTEFIGSNILHFDTIDSTNTYAKKIASKEIDGTVVISEEQTLGRGRLGRVWNSKAYEGIWMSIILKPNILPYKTPFLTIIAGASIANALNNLGVNVGIKWPNDIILNGKKLCGILTELSAEIERVNYIVLGIGMNVKNLSFPSDLGLLGEVHGRVAGMALAGIGPRGNRLLLRRIARRRAAGQGTGPGDQARSAADFQKVST